MSVPDWRFATSSDVASETRVRPKADISTRPSGLAVATAWDAMPVATRLECDATRAVWLGVASAQEMWKSIPPKTIASAIASRRE